jgi:flagellar protein FlaF
MNPSTTQYASKVYAKTAKELADPRQLEASLLLEAAAKLQAVHDSWDDKPPASLSEALLYNRKLWLVFIDAVTNDGNGLPVETRQNIANLGGFVLCEIFSLITKPKPEYLVSLITINRRLAAGLSAKPPATRRSSSPQQQPIRAANGTRRGAAGADISPALTV